MAGVVYYESDDSSESDEEFTKDQDVNGVDQDEGLSKMLDSDSSSSDKDDDEDETGKKKKRKVVVVLILTMKILKEPRRREDPLLDPAVPPPLRRLRSLTRTRKERPWLLTCLTQMLLSNQMQRSLHLNSLVLLDPAFGSPHLLM